MIRVCTGGRSTSDPGRRTTPSFPNFLIKGGSRGSLGIFATANIEHGRNDHYKGLNTVHVELFGHLRASHQLCAADHGMNGAFYIEVHRLHRLQKLPGQDNVATFQMASTPEISDSIDNVHRPGTRSLSQPEWPDIFVFYI